MKKFIAALLAGLTLFTLVGCSGGSKADSSTPKDYSLSSSLRASWRIWV